MHELYCLLCIAFPCDHMAAASGIIIIFLRDSLSVLNHMSLQSIRGMRARRETYYDDALVRCRKRVVPWNPGDWMPPTPRAMLRLAFINFVNTFEVCVHEPRMRLLLEIGVIHMSSPASASVDNHMRLL